MPRSDHPWVTMKGLPFRGAGRNYVDPILGGFVDGYPHRRIHQSGVCVTCGHGPDVEHASMLPSHAVDAPIYWQLITRERTLADLRMWLLIRGVPEDLIETWVTEARARLEG
ncbi:hypothetical protein SEA_VALENTINIPUFF_48 [Microbacterium phage ValentiniPuff]|uniref:Uncharacterized protein n=1 Tax=Microbacterium phage ValentiniPuff TaxID=2315705 RepID=A0A386KP21_9CAUD|nr:hypothetical protein SEA_VALENTINIPUFF_48 [Microbacterium phage ValentiniPuff]